MLTKVSVCLLLLRIHPSKKVKMPIQSLICFLLLSNVALSLLWAFQCIPMDAAWNATKRKTAKCFREDQIDRIIMCQASMFPSDDIELTSPLMQSVMSIISDFILAGFPIIVLFNVQMKRSKKIVICGLMGLGLMCEPVY